MQGEEFSVYSKKAGYSVDGLDLSQHWIHFAKETFDLDVMHGTADVLLSLGKKYDLIILSHVAEHWVYCWHVFAN